ncbi:MaoC family dehydratase N-terminal domain-containing protein [Isoalcanivorax beigongshangi]|uniref:MaoC family dehydratase N-terminal domain-containing protein n=1 Tax=Isoalcanivorax beigongshangi TaxID=3238810 RepID=A0ABV4AKG0_9GAMM
MIDTRFIGTELPSFSVDVEAGRLRFFAKATGNADPIYVDREAARAAGYSDIPIPPTFLFCLEMESPQPSAMRELLNIDIGKVLHGEQQFIYHRPVCVGDRITFAPRISDIYAKKGGALEFVVRQTRVTNQHDQLVAELNCVTVVRNS